MFVGGKVHKLHYPETKTLITLRHQTVRVVDQDHAATTDGFRIQVLLIASIRIQRHQIALIKLQHYCVRVVDLDQALKMNGIRIQVLLIALIRL